MPFQVVIEVKLRPLQTREEAALHKLALEQSFPGIVSAETVRVYVTETEPEVPDGAVETCPTCHWVRTGPELACPQCGVVYPD